MGRTVQSFITFGATYDDTTWIKIIVERLTLTQELGCKENIITLIFSSDILCVANRDSRLNHHDSLRIHFHYDFDDLFNMTCVKVVLYWVVISWCGNDYKVSIFISRLCIHRGGEV